MNRGICIFPFGLLPMLSRRLVFQLQALGWGEPEHSAPCWTVQQLLREISQRTGALLPSPTFKKDILCLWYK